MEATFISAEPRTSVGRGLGQLRRAGMTPLTLYGKTVEQRSLQTDTRSLERVVQASGLSQLVDVRIGEETIKVLFREVQRHPVSHSLLHVDAYALQMDEKQTLQIPLHLVGRLSTEIPSEYIVIQNTEFITVETLPDRIPDSLEIDLGLLTMDHNLQIRDLEAVEGIDYSHDPDEVIVSLSRTGTADEEEEAEELSEELEGEVAEEEPAEE